MILMNRNKKKNKVATIETIVRYFKVSSLKSTYDKIKSDFHFVIASEEPRWLSSAGGAPKSMNFFTVKAFRVDGDKDQVKRICEFLSKEDHIIRLSELPAGKFKVISSKKEPIASLVEIDESEKWQWFS